MISNPNLLKKTDYLYDKHIITMNLLPTLKSLSIFSLFLLISIFTPDIVVAQVPTVQDCLGAIPVCTDTYVQPTVYGGTGNYPNEIHPDEGCPRSCMSSETNSIWYVISVKTGGLLRLVISPVVSSDDYDWAVFNMNTMECSDIYNNAIFMQSSCNAAGGNNYHGSTGISSANGGTSNCNEGGPTNKWNADLSVQTGDTYVLCVSNWTPESSAGYTLDFSASTADIFDNVQAVISTVNTDIGCAGATSISFDFTENIKCLSIQPDDFILIGPDGTEHIVNSVNGAGCQAGGEQEKYFTIGFYPPMYLDGTYSLNMIGAVTDLCTNSSGPHSKEFTVALDPLPAILTQPADVMVPVGGSATFVVTAVGDTSFRWQYRASSAGFWQNLDEIIPYSGTTTSTLTVNPATFDMGQYQYRCIVSGDCPPPTQSAAAILSVGDALAASASVWPEEICVGDLAQLDVTASGGNVLGTYSYVWTFPDGSTSNLQNPSVQPETTTTYSVVVDDGFNPVSSQVTVIVHPLPVASAGSDIGIIYGTFTTLAGSASIGADPYIYAWEPADSLWTPNAQNPVTKQLKSSNIFTLVVTDGNNCVSEPDLMQVNVIGGPLAASPMALPAEICFGDSTRLFAVPGGGVDTLYRYSWSLNGEEFSTAQNPTVIPSTADTYTYTLWLTDDNNDPVTREVNVIVDPLPVISLILPQHHVVDGIIQNCVYDTLILDAGNPGQMYFWGNGSTGQTITISTSGLSFDLQEHWVRVTDDHGCVSHDTVQVMFTFTDCSYGINDLTQSDLIKLFPNPANGSVTVSIDGKPDDFLILITDLSGRIMLRDSFSKKSEGVSNHTIDLGSLSGSSYLVKISSPDVFVIKKLVISH